MRPLPATEPLVPTRARHRQRLFLLLAAASLLSACQGETAPPDKQPERVGTTAVEITPFAPTVSLTGTVAARVESDLSFRIAGRIEARNVDVGAHVVPGQVLATIDTEEQEADLESARATLTAADATLRQAQTNFDRQTQLLDGGFTTKSTFDAAQEALRTAQGSVEAARADVATAEDQLGYTVLRADAPGIVTARNAEAGQVVDAAQTVFTVAQDGGRDAIFDVYEAAFANQPTDNAIDVRLVSDRSVASVGTIREVAPTFDSTNGTVRVKVDLSDPPAAMTLGSAVVGAARFSPRDAVVLPWTAFFAEKGRPTVWVVDPASKTVSQRAIVVDRYLTGAMVVREGLKSGEIVVVAGGQLLSTGQAVSFAEGDAR